MRTFDNNKLKNVFGKNKTNGFVSEGVVSDEINIKYLNTESSNLKAVPSCSLKLD